MCRCPVTWLTILFLATSSATLSAQVSKRLSVDGRVRVAVDSSDWVYGTFQGLTADSLTLEREEVGAQLSPRSSSPSWVSIPLGSISRLEQSLGHQSNVLRGMGYGFLIGTAAGAATAAVCAAEGECDLSDPYGQLAFGFFIGAGALLGTVTGLVVGTITSGERWEEVPLDQLQVSFVPQRDGRFALGLSVRF